MSVALGNCGALFQLSRFTPLIHVPKKVAVGMIIK
jgi:hypothetical protein